MTELDQVHAAVKQESLRDPASAASNPDLHVWLMESCALCGQALAGNKAVKQHLNRQHPEVMSRVQQLITPRLQQHKVMMKKGCQTKVDAPGRHSEQCVPLLQTHVLQEAQRQGLDMTPRAYEAQPKKPSKQNKAKAAPQVGLQAPVFVLHGFWLLANRRNHCYANSVLQILHWAVPTADLSLLQEPKRASRLAHLTPEHPSLEPATRGWTFDGRQQDAAEFLTAILPNFSPLSLGAWETRSPLESGYIVDEEGTFPVFLNVDMAADLQTMINSWSNRSPIQAFLPPARFVCLALPRYAGRGKNSQPVQLQGAVALPFFAGADSTIARVPFRLRSGIVHLGSEPTSGHYRSFVLSEGQWYLGDDACPPSACQLADPLIACNCYLLLLEHQAD